MKKTTTADGKGEAAALMGSEIHKEWAGNGANVTKTKGKLQGFKALHTFWVIALSTLEF